MTSCPNDFWFAVVLAALVAGGLSCGGNSTDYSSLGLVDVSGTVTLDGQPLPNARVVFEYADKRSASGVTDESGYYELSYTSEKKGALPGQATVRIRTTPDPDSDEYVPPEDGSPPPVEQVPAKYNTKSELTVTVKPDESQSFDFDLELKE